MAGDDREPIGRKGKQPKNTASRKPPRRRRDDDYDDYEEDEYDDDEYEEEEERMPRKLNFFQAEDGIRDERW